MWKKILGAALYILLFPILLFLLAGDWEWREGWVFTVWFLLLCYTTIAYLYRRDPGLLAERFRKPGTGSQPATDRRIVYLLVPGFAAWFAVMPLDARRFMWSPPFPSWAVALGVAGLAVSFFFFFRSYADNPFLSPLVRVQEERGHKVVSTGVYALVRHPMYLGAVLMFLTAPLLLGSLLGIVAGILLSVLLMVRIRGEEELLARDLPGYAEYCGRVRYRLIPLVW